MYEECDGRTILKSELRAYKARRIQVLPHAREAHEDIARWTIAAIAGDKILQWKQWIRHTEWQQLNIRLQISSILRSLSEYANESDFNAPATNFCFQRSTTAGKFKYDTLLGGTAAFMDVFDKCWVAPDMTATWSRASFSSPFSSASPSASASSSCWKKCVMLSM